MNTPTAFTTIPEISLAALRDLYADELAAPTCRGKAAAETRQSIAYTTDLLAVIQDTVEKQVRA